MIQLLIGAVIAIATMVGGMWYTGTVPQQFGAQVLQVRQGGTGLDSAPKYPIVGGGSIEDFSASGTPWVVGINATSTTASSTFQGLTAQNFLIANGFFQTGLNDCNGSSNKVVYTLLGGKLSCDTDQTGAGGGSFPFTPETLGNATSTLILLKAGLITNGSTTVTTNLNLSGTFNASSTSAFGQLATFYNGFISQASSTFTGNATTTGIHSIGTLQIGGDALNELVGTGLQNVGNALTLNATGDWTGTIDGNNFAGGAIGAGDLLYGSGAGTLAELTIGTNGMLLGVSNNLPSWISTSTLLTEGERSWNVDAAGYLTPTTTITTLHNNGLISQASSTFTQNLNINGVVNASSTAIFSNLITGNNGVLIIGASSTITSLYISNALQIPNGTAPTVDAVGETALDTTSNNVVIATSTTGHIVLGSATSSLYAFSVASTSADFVSGGIIDLPAYYLPQNVTAIMCHVDGGTSVVINLSDGTNDTNQITCTTTRNQYSITSNASFTAYEAMRLEVGTVTGSVDYVVIRVLGYRTTD